VPTVIGLGHIIGSEHHKTWYNFKHGTINSDFEGSISRYRST
jgi:hypothetical protein